jgi:hypothetical protein
MKKCPEINALKVQYLEDESLKSTSSRLYVDALIFTFKVDFAGQYLVSWYCEVAQADGNEFTNVRIIDEINYETIESLDEIVVDERRSIVGETNNFFGKGNKFISVCGLKQIYFSKEVKRTIRLQYNTSAQRSYIRRIRLHIIRNF